MLGEEPAGGRRGGGVSRRWSFPIFLKQDDVKRVLVICFIAAEEDKKTRHCAATFEFTFDTE